MNEQKLLAKKILDSYEVKGESKADKLVALDKAVRTPAEILAYTLGVIGSLILGVGMCLAMGVIATGIVWMIVGIAIGVVGIALVSVNYFIYRAVLISRKEKYGEQIKALASEILSESAK